MRTYFTQRAREAVNYALQEASQKNHAVIGPEYLLLGLLNKQELIRKCLRH